jgi:hypothetical protein
MKKLLIVSILIITAAALRAQGEWSLVRNSDGIRVFTKPSENSSLDQFMGKTVVDAKLEVVVELIRDVDAQPQWMADCIEARVVKKYTEEDILVYNVTRAPWPVSNRDVVVRSRGGIDVKSGKVSIIFNAVKDSPVPPRSGIVRMTDLLGQWHLKSAGDNKTEVIYIMRANPAGNIPASIANMTSKNIPFRTLSNMKQMVKKEKYINLAREKYKQQ